MLARNFVKLLEPVSIVRVPSWSGLTIIDQYRSPTIYQLGSTSIRQPKSSFSTSTVSWKKKTPKERDPIPEPHNIHRLPLEETLPADDGEPRPNSVADLTRQLTIVDSNIDVESDHKLQLKWSTPQPHLEAPKHPGEYVLGEWPPKGRVYWKLPFKVTLQAGRIYKWCSCGASKSQPFCDGSHHSVMTGPNFEFPTKPKFRPVKFRVPEDGEYWLCQCKQTNDRPFCDGTHRTMEEITKLERPMPTDGKRVTVKIKG